MRRFVVLLAAFVVACGANSSEPSPAEGTHMERQPIDEVLASNAERLMAIEGIQGIAVGETESGEPCLLILSTVDPAQLAPVVGDSVGGWPVRIQGGDEIRPLH